MKKFNAVLVILLFALLISGCVASSSVSSVKQATPPLTEEPPATSMVEPAETTFTPQLPSTATPTPTFTFTPTPPPSATPTAIVSPTTAPSLTPTSTSPPIPKPVAGSRADIQRVMIISIDGLRPDALAQSDTPVLDRLITQGAYSDSAQTVVPSATLVGHASMLGGMTPEHHGIYWNIYNPELGKIKGPTLFTVAREAGLTSVLIAGKPRLEHIVLPNSVDVYDYAGYLDQITVAHALDVIETRMPNILFVHLPDVDEQGHATGWMSEAQFQTIHQTDARIGEMVAALDKKGYLKHTLLLVTADHGGEGYRHGGDTPGEITIPWLAVGPGVQPGLLLQREVMVYDTAATAAYALGLPVPPAWDGRPVVEIFGED